MKIASPGSLHYEHMLLLLQYLRVPEEEEPVGVSDDTDQKFSKCEKCFFLLVCICSALLKLSEGVCSHQVANDQLRVVYQLFGFSKIIELFFAANLLSSVGYCSWSFIFLLTYYAKCNVWCGRTLETPTLNLSCISSKQLCYSAIMPVV